MVSHIRKYWCLLKWSSHKPYVVQWVAVVQDFLQANLYSHWNHVQSHSDHERVQKQFYKNPQNRQTFYFCAKRYQEIIKLCYFPIKFWNFVVILFALLWQKFIMLYLCGFCWLLWHPIQWIKLFNNSVKMQLGCLRFSDQIKMGDKHMAFLIKEYFKGDLSCNFWTSAFKNLRQSFLNFNFTSLGTWGDFKFSLGAVPSFISFGCRHESAFVKSSLISLFDEFAFYIMSGKTNIFIILLMTFSFVSVHYLTKMRSEACQIEKKLRTPGIRMQ